LTFGGAIDFGVFGLTVNSHSDFADFDGDFAMGQHFADHEENALHVDSRCNALKQGSGDCVNHNKNAIRGAKKLLFAAATQ
jgi:hypothetical protein